MPVPPTEIPAEEITKWTGLYRTVNPAALPPGAMYQADNVVVPAPSVLTSRRGYRAGTSAPGGRNRVKALSFFGEYALFLDNLSTTTVSAQNTDYPGQYSLFFEIQPGWGPLNPQNPLYNDLTLAPPTLSAYGYDVAAMTPPNRFFAANGNMYLTTNFGALRLSSTPTGLAASQSQIAGMPAPMITSVANVAGSFLKNQYQVAYRVTLTYTDAAGNEVMSPPSDRRLYTNTTGSPTAVAVYCSSWDPFYGTVKVQLWRTKSVPVSTIYPDVAGDEMFLVYENTVTAGPGFTLTGTGYITDDTPDIPWLQDPLYTNPTTGDVNGLGIANANTAPPAAYDVATFKGRTYYANTEEVQRAIIQIIGTGTGGIQNNDTITIGGVQYKFIDDPAVTVAAPYYRVLLYYVGNTHGLDLGSQDANINQTALNLAVKITSAGSGQAADLFPPTINPRALLTHTRGNFLSDEGNSAPGLVGIQRIVPGAPAFTVTAGTGAGRGFAGLLTNVTSDSNRQPANLMQSHFNQPEAVPPAFTETIGRKDRPILRVLPLRDSCFVFKGNRDGLWRFTDDGDGNLTIGPLDQTVNCVAPETVVSLNNAAYALCDKGVLRITDGGAPENISNERIQTELAQFIANAGDNITRAFAVAYEAERMYILCLPLSSTDLTCDVQYVYSELTDAWTRWLLPGVTCGGVNPSDGKLYFGRDISAHEGNILWVERKDFTDTDYQDETFTRQVPGVGTYTASSLTFSGDLRNTYHVGDLFSYVHGGSAFSIRVTDVVWNVGPNQTVVTVSSAVTWTAGDTFTQYTGIQCQLQLLPLTDGMPLYEKQWQNVYFYFRRETFDQCHVGYSTEKQPNPLEYDLAGSPELAFLWSETLGFGLEPWGQHAQDVVLKLALDQASARSSDLTLRWKCADARASWQLSAIRIPYDPSTLRLVR